MLSSATRRRPTAPSPLSSGLMTNYLSQLAATFEVGLADTLVEGPLPSEWFNISVTMMQPNHLGQQPVLLLG